MNFNNSRVPSTGRKARVTATPSLARQRLRRPADERLDRLVLRQPQCIVHPGGLPVAIFRTLPELALVGAGEERPVLLRLVAEDRLPLAGQLVRPARPRHLHPLRPPRLPRAAVEPHFTVGEPCPRL